MTTAWITAISTMILAISAIFGIIGFVLTSVFVKTRDQNADVINLHSRIATVEHWNGTHHNDLQELKYKKSNTP